jgi:hypothetical protein
MSLGPFWASFDGPRRFAEVASDSGECLKEDTRQFCPHGATRCTSVGVVWYGAHRRDDIFLWEGVICVVGVWHEYGAIYKGLEAWLSTPRTLTNTLAPWGARRRAASSPSTSSRSLTVFKILREWDPLKTILAIWPPKSHVRLINTISYFKRVVSIKMRVCWAGNNSFRLSQPKWGQLC